MIDLGGDLFLADPSPFLVLICTYALSAARPLAVGISGVGAYTVALPSVYLMPNQTLSRLPGLAPR